MGACSHDPEILECRELTHLPCSYSNTPPTLSVDMQFGRKFESIINDDPAHTPVALRAVIPPDKPGALIGVKGQVHRQIEDMFNVRLVLHMVRDQYGRLLQIFGHPKRIAPALRDALIRMYGQRQFELNYGQVTIFYMSIWQRGPYINLSYRK